MSILISRIQVHKDEHGEKEKWPLVTLGAICDFQNGFPFDSTNFYEHDGYPLIRIRNLKKGITSTKYLGDYSAEFVVNDGDLLVGMDGEFNAALWRGGSALLNQRVVRIMPHTNVLLDWVFLNITKRLKQIETNTDAVTVKHISTKQIKNITIPLPPLSTQREIVSILDAASYLKKKRAEADKKMAEFVPALFYQMFGDPGRNEKGWEVRRLGEAATVDWGNTKLTKAAYDPSGEYLGVSAAGADGRMNHFEHNEDVIVISAIGANCGRVLFPQVKFTAIKNTMTVTPTLEILSPLYVFSVLDKNRIPKRGGGQPFLSKGDTQEYQIPVPPLNLQKQFASRAAEARKTQEQQATSRKKLEEAFEGVMSAFL